MPTRPQFRRLFAAARSRFLLDAEFNTAFASAPAVLNVDIGTLTVTQVDGAFSVSGGKLVFTAQSTPVFGDERVVGDPLGRVVGRVLTGRATLTTANQFMIGWAHSTAPTTFPMRAFYSVSGTWRAYDSAGNGIVINQNATANVEHDFALVIRSSGCTLFLKVGGQWTRVWTDTDSSPAIIYPFVSNYDSAGSVNHLRVFDLATPFDVDYADATFNVTADGQSLGAELLTNGDFSAWTADNPDGWTVVGESGSDPAVHQVGSGENHTGVGTGYANLYQTATANRPALRQTVLTVGGIYEVGVNVNNVAAGNYGVGSTGETAINLATTGVKRAIFRTTTTIFNLFGSAANSDVTVDDPTIKRITLASAQVSKADAIHVLEYTLPVSPIAGQKMILWYRGSTSSSELSDGWSASLIRNDANSAWDVKMESWGSGTPTSQISVTGVGATDALMVVANGKNHDLYTRNGTTWTKRGTTAISTFLMTTVNCNYIYSSGFTFGRLVSFPIYDTRYRTLLDFYPATWTAFEDFITSTAAPLSNITTEVGGHTITMVQTDGQFSAYGSALVFPVQSTPVFGDLGFYMSPSGGGGYARTAGKAFIGHVKITTLGNGVVLGLSQTASVALGEHSLGVFGGVATLRDNGADLAVITLSANVDYLMALVLRPTGCYYFIKGGSLYPDWTLLWIDDVTTSATHYLEFENRTQIGTVNLVGVRDLSGGFQTDGGLCTFDATDTQGALGSELISNGTFETNITGWSGYNAPDTLERNTVSPISGTGDLHIGDNESVNTEAYLTAGVAVTSGTFYEIGVKGRKVDSRLQVIIVGDVGGTGTAATTVLPFSTGDLALTNTTYRKVRRALSTTTVYPKIVINDAATQRDVYMDDFTMKSFTLAAEKTSPLAGFIALTFTAPASPAAGDEVGIFYRVAAAGEEMLNCWYLHVTRNDTNTAWDIKLDSFAAGTATNRISVTGITTPTEISVLVEGNNHSVFTRDVTTGLWTQRGSTISNSLYNTATLCSYIRTSAFTIGTFRSWARTVSENTAYSQLDLAQ